MLGYPVAGANEEMGVGQRRFNFVWYRPADADHRLADMLTDIDGVRHELSIPPTKIRAEIFAAMRRDAERLLAPQLAEVEEGLYARLRRQPNDLSEHGR